MKLATVILLTAIMQVSANGFAQRLTLNQENVSLNKVFKEIRKQTGYHVLWKPDKLNANTTIVANFKNASLDKVMEQCLYGRGLTYIIDEKTIVIKAMPQINPVVQDVITVAGKVTEKVNKLPLIGVNVSSVENNKLRAVTDANGDFEIKVPANTKLRFKMIGYQDVVVTAKARLDIEMDVMIKELEEVVIGYGTQKKDLVTGSIVTMTMDDTRRNSPTTSLGNLLAGQMAGVRVNTPTGKPGTAPGISIRAKTSFNDQNILYVIDGLVTADATDFNNLSPNDVDKISVLKDAASTAAYGARASGGVVVVTTRRGAKNEKAKINYSFNTGFDKRGRNADRTSAIESGEIYNRINPNASDLWTKSDFDYFKNINNGWGYDQLDAIWQDPYTTSHNLSASGGSDELSYFIGGSYVDQSGFQQNTRFQKYNIRANITADIAKNLTVFAGITANNNVNNLLPFEGAEGLYRKHLIWQPYQPVWTDGGKPIDYGWIGNIGAETRGDGGYLRTNFIKPVINLKGTYKIPFVEGLSLSSQYIRAFSNNREKTFQKKYDMYVLKTIGTHQISTKDEDITSFRKSTQIGNNYIRERYKWNDDSQLNFQLSYDHTFANVHHVQGWLAYERAEGKTGGVSASREKFPVYLTDQWWAASGDRADTDANGDTEQPTGRKSYVGQFFYDYDSKYLASFTYRYDGSYKFPANKRWGFFPSGSLGWVISRENFFSSVNGIELLKLRASVGTTSADNIAAWQYQQSYKNGSSAYFGTTPSTSVGVQYGTLVNPDITWEKSRNYNVGVDINFLKHFNASAEYFKIKTYNILVERVAQVPPTFSRKLPTSNYGEYQSEGVEMSFGYRNKTNKLNYYANMNAGYAAGTPLVRDKVVTYPWEIDVNLPASKVTGFVNTGMIRTQADLDAFVAANPNYKFKGIVPALGQLTYADLSGKDGKPDGVVDDWDKTIIKKNNSPISLGLNLGFEWKGFSVDASFAGSLHNYKMVNNLVAGNVEWNRMWKPWANDAWTPENPNGSLPKRYSVNDATSNVTNTESTFWLKNANFLRMRLLNVGYSIPSSITNKLGINGVKVYFSGSNLFVISKFNKEYFDPELGDGFNYPTMKNFNFGINVSL